MDNYNDQKAEEDILIGNLTEPIKYLKESLKKKFSLNQAVLLSIALEKLKRYEDAISLIQNAYQYLPVQEADKEKALLFQRMGQIEHSMGKLEIAIQHLQSAKERGAALLTPAQIREIDSEILKIRNEVQLQTAPNKSAALASQGKNLENQKLYKEAISLYTQSLEEEQKSTIYFQRGRCYHFIGKNKKAIDDFKKSLEMRKPKTLSENYGAYPILFYLGKSYMEISDYKEACRILEQAAEFSGKLKCVEDYELIIGILELAQFRQKVFF